MTGVTVSGADNTAQPLISVVSRKLRVRARVNEADIGRVLPGQEATFTVNAYPGKTFHATVTAVAPQAETVSNVQLYDVLLEIDGKANGLRAGMPCNVTIITARKSNVLVVPRQALSFANSYIRRHDLTVATSTSAEDAAFVVVVTRGTPKPRRIRTGLADTENVEVVAGLAAGEAVAIAERAAGEKKASVTSSTSARSGSTPLMPPGPPGGRPR